MTNVKDFGRFIYLDFWELRQENFTKVLPIIVEQNQKKLCSVQFWILVTFYNKHLHQKYDTDKWYAPWFALQGETL